MLRESHDSFNPISSLAMICPRYFYLDRLVGIKQVIPYHPNLPLSKCPNLLTLAFSRFLKTKFHAFFLAE